MKFSVESVVIERLAPLLDGGRYPIKRIIGEDLEVEADVFKDGHDVVAAALLWRKEGSKNWHETPMQPLVNDRWAATCSFYDEATYEYTIQAWPDFFASWREEFVKKFKAGLENLWSEMLEGAALVEKAASLSGESDDKVQLLTLGQKMRAASPEEVFAMATSAELNGLMTAWPDKSLASTFPVYGRVRVQREKAAFAAWYEFFPRSAEGKPDSGSRFRDCLPRIDDAKRMGFDVIYFPPIHPIGETNRKGRNNSTTCEPGEPGVPYAIGSKHGGHKAVEPALGTLADFDWLVKEIQKRDMEIALDFAINCSPDHPYVAEHPDWFFKRPDGSIKYAENPPKKYEDVYPLNFHNPDWKALWQEMTDIILFWSKRGVRIFRVDNPHTKPVAFWEFLISEVHKKYPDVIFLSEAFTRPKMMRVLAKAGFTQSYTYFTWRNSKQELAEYFTELTETEMADYFQANLWPNTPDILPLFLQQGGRPAFLIRSTLAATLSPVWGMYSGFELCENAAVPGKEEYIDSEKYQFKGRDWDAPVNIKAHITALNRIRHENRALHEYRNLRFHRADNEHILFYSKVTKAADNILLIVVNLDPFHKHGAHVHVPLELCGLTASEMFQAHDLLSGERYLWHGPLNYVELDPHLRPAQILRIRRWAGKESDFDYFH